MSDGSERLSRRDAFVLDKDSTTPSEPDTRRDLFKLIIGERDDPLVPDNYPELTKDSKSDLYSICVRKPSEDFTPQVVQQAFGKYGNLTKINITPKFIFLCFRTKKSAVSCLETESENFQISIPPNRSDDSSANAGKGEEPACHHCHETGHNKQVCPKLTGIPLKCHLCDEGGHKVQDCPSNPGPANPGPTKTDETPTDEGHIYRNSPQRPAAAENSPGGPPTGGPSVDNDKVMHVISKYAASSPGQSGHRGGPCVYVGGIPETMGKADIEDIVKPYGSKQVFYYLRKPTDNRGSCRYAFAYFATMEQAQKVCVELNEKEKPEFFGKKLQFRIVRDKSRARIIEDGGRDNRRGGLPPNVQRQNEMMQYNAGMGRSMGRGIPSLMDQGHPSTPGMVQVPMAKLQVATDLVYRIGGLMQEVLDDCYFCGRVTGLHKELEHLMGDITQHASSGTVGRGGHVGHSGGHMGAPTYGLGRGLPSPGRGRHQSPGRPWNAGRGSKTPPYVETDSGVFGAVDFRYKQQSETSPLTSPVHNERTSNGSSPIVYDFVCKYGPNCKRMNDENHLRQWKHPHLDRGIPGGPQSRYEDAEDGAGGDYRGKPATMGQRLQQGMPDS